MALDKATIRRKYPRVDIFLKREKNKHKCGCGCDEVIELKKSHYWNGIPAYIFGHAARLRRGAKDYDRNLYYCVEDIAKLANVSDQTVRLWNRDRKIIAEKTIGRKNLYTKAAIEKFLEDRPERQRFDRGAYLSVQDLKQMGVSRSKLRSLVRAGKIQEPRHHARKTHYLKSEIENFRKEILEDPKVASTKKTTVSKSAFNKIAERLKELEQRVQMLEDCMLSD